METTHIHKAIKAEEAIIALDSLIEVFNRLKSQKLKML